jgi:hypothetical protein
MAESVLLIAGDELAEVREALAELRVEFRSVRPTDAAAVARTAPTRLLVTTARHALLVEPGTARPGPHPVRMAILDEDSKTVCARLRERGFDYLVRRPVHPIALQLLLLRALYRGDERRVSPRIPIGAMASYRTSLRWRPALVADLARRGCRFYVAKALEPDTQVRIQLPKELTGGPPIELAGWVVRCERDPLGSAELPFCVALAFELLPAETDDALALLLDAKATGPERLTPAEAEQAWREWTERAQARRAASGTPRAPDAKKGRRAPRRRFRSRVAAIRQRDRAMRVLVGRNLSLGGMLIDPDPELRVGERLALALFGKPEQRISLHARVVRSDAGGVALSFESPSPEATRELEAVVAGLPCVERTEGGGAIATVVGEIARRERVRGSGRS